MSIGIFFLIFLVFLLIGMPIYLAMLIPSVIYLTVQDMSLLMVVQKMVNSMNSFTMLAIPFFIMAAQVMNTGSVTNRIFDFARKLVGRFRGGLGYVNVLASVIFSGMSGSAVADVGGLGQVEIKAMREAGYEEDFTIGVTAASGTIGPIIPPSIPFVIYATYAGVSTGALFMAGILPGVMMALILCVMCFYMARKQNAPKDVAASFGEVVRSFKGSIGAMLMPLIIIGGIWTGIFTPTEAAMIATAYAILLSLFGYKDIKFRQLKDVIYETIDNTMPIMLVITSATIFSWIVSYERLDQQMFAFLTSFITSKTGILIVINIMVLVLGMFFDCSVIVMLLTPLIMPLAREYGISMIHMGVVIVLNAMIGLLTPPVGYSLYVLNSVTGHSVTKISKWCAPWLVPLAASLLLVTLWEPLCMTIPRLLGIG